MRAAPFGRFSLGDAMVMIAALTPSLVLIRVGANLGLFELGKTTEIGRSPTPLARQFVEYFNVDALKQVVLEHLEIATQDGDVR